MERFSPPPHFSRFVVYGHESSKTHLARVVYEQRRIEASSDDERTRDLLDAGSGLLASRETSNKSCRDITRTTRQGANTSSHRHYGIIRPIRFLVVFISLKRTVEVESGADGEHEGLCLMLPHQDLLLSCKWANNLQVWMMSWFLAPGLKSPADLLSLTEQPGVWADHVSCQRLNQQHEDTAAFLKFRVILLL